MLNRVTITGRLTADPEFRETQSGIAVSNFSIACQRNYKNADGEFDADFFNVEAWRQTAEFVSSYFAKGAMMSVDGHLQSQKYQDKAGNNRTAIKIVADHVYFGESKTQKEDAGNGQRIRAASPVAAPSEYIPNPEDFEDLDEDDDLPF